MPKLANKVAVITGGTTGIGLATAKLFSHEGAQVIVTGKNPKTLEAARRDLEGRAEVIAADATRLADIDRLFDHVKTRHGRLDVLFANVGGGKFRPLSDVDEAYFDELIALNLKSAYFAVQKAVPLLPRGGAIVLNTTIAGAKAFPATSVYGAAKAGLRQLARSLGVELLERGIRVNAVSPGPIETPIFDKLGLGDQKGAMLGQFRERNPMKRFGTADEVARAALFLASDDSSFITGTELAVDGGMSQF
jgi:NAD(P)-dependent dehydrogenase (short-subunit alcohol dehydrogenase family)